MIALIVALGCSYPEADFRDDLDAAACDWQTDCFHYQSYDTCLDAAAASRSPIAEDCTYDPDAARECVRDYEAIDCPGEDADAAVPAACEAVWACY